MNKTIFIILVTCFLTGCNFFDKPTPEAEALILKNSLDSINSENQQAISNPTLIGTTPFGDDIYVAKIKYVCPDCNPEYDYEKHTLYFIGNTITKNYKVRNGKSHKDKVAVFLGQNPSSEEIIKEAERLKKEIENQEEKEYLRLKEKFDK